MRSNALFKQLSCCLQIFYFKIQEMAKRCSQPSSSTVAVAPSATSAPSLMALSPRQHLPSQSACLLDSQGEPLEETVSRTARVPPPKILPSAVRRADSFTATAQLPPQVSLSSYFLSLKYDRACYQ